MVKYSLNLNRNWLVKQYEMVNQKEIMVDVKSEEFLKFKTVRTLLKFCVGPKEVPNFRMIERHYFKGKLLRNYDFTFGFCIPNSTNTWEAIYDMPENSPKTIEEMVSSSASSSNHSNTHTGALSRRSINDF